MAKFEVQARVVDLLGTQQIANCPTAISELFKNAYDAYARKVMLDVDPENDQAYLWDDGVGMTETELFQRWLVVGAAGKDKLRSSTEPPKGMAQRPIQGEKGIGRLAISTLGDTLLLVSRSLRIPNGADPYVALLINWNIVRNSQLLLSEIEIPTVTFLDLSELDSGIVRALVDAQRSVIRATESAWRGENEKLRELILRQLDGFEADLPRLQVLVNEQSGNGTIFYIRDLVPEFRKYTQDNLGDESSPYTELVQLLSNFRKTFEDKPGEKSELEEFRADVRCFDSGSRRWRSFFEEREAIGPEDLRSYDHYMDIAFDELGRFEGTLEIFGKPVQLPARELQVGTAFSCGAFQLRLWYFQGRKDETTLKPEQWVLIDKKLDLFGGLMIYRDNLRVLPYGRHEFDWLGFEERRSRGAGRYFFSYRRMFGYVDITRSGNPNLIDKAGREGLIQNTAYRDMQLSLRNFFSQIALRYFKKGDFEQQKNELRDRDKKLGEERKRIEQRRKELHLEAQQKLDFIEKNSAQQLESLLGSVLDEIVKSGKAGPQEIAAAIIRFQDRLAQVEGRARLTVPADLPLGRNQTLRKLVVDHRKAFGQFAAACQEIRGRFGERIRDSWPEAERAVDRQRIVDNAYRQALSRVGVAYKAAVEAATEAKDRISDKLKAINDEQRERIDRVILDSTGAKTVEDARRSEGIEPSQVLGSLARSADDAVAYLESQRERLVAAVAGYLEGPQAESIKKYQFEEIEELREQVDRNLELVQLGLSVELIDHELNRLYRGIHGHLASLRSMVRNAPNASRLVEDLRGSFQHLEDRYKLMSPLYRGSYRQKSRIDGVRIFNYCRSFLESALRSVGVNLQMSDAFRTFAIEEAPAIVLPVFVNLVDNAIYWLRDQPDRRIIFDRCGEVITICDSGPGIHPALFEEIFEPFVSSKIGGRGLGLYIARANLIRYHHEIWASEDPHLRKLKGACICIHFHSDVVLKEN